MTTDGASLSAGAPAIDEADFRRLIGRRAERLLALAGHLIGRTNAGGVTTRPLLGALLAESTQLEELLDGHGARNNRRWYQFRSLVAACKLFADIGYELLHVRHALPSYRLLPIEHDFSKATDEALAFTDGVLLRWAEEIRRKAGELHLPTPAATGPQGAFDDTLLPGHLAQDRIRQTTETVGETVTRLATAFLNLNAESGLVHAVGRARPEDYPSYVPDPVSEESLRDLQYRFHSLQSLYDTYVARTETEALDGDLPVLRGHITVVFHLLKTATAFVHYYERHPDVEAHDEAGRPVALVCSDRLLTMLMTYSIRYASCYLQCAQNLSQSKLQDYAQIGSIEVPVPRYRGFHVRPATLVAKIVAHYGSRIRMVMAPDEEGYDAGTPIEIFRANEGINARKRRWLCAQLACLDILRGEPGECDVREVTRQVVQTVADDGKIVIYERPLQVPEQPALKEGTLLARVVAEIARLQATGKIDMVADLNVTFVGDTRVLADIELLAKCGYGEDNFGNNVPLPAELAYLRR